MLKSSLSVLVAVLLSVLSDTNALTIRGSFDPFTEIFVRDLAFAYTLANPDASFNITSSSEFQPSAFQAILDDELDFALGSLMHPFLTEESVRNVSLFSLPILTASIVTCYRLDALGSDTVPIILTMEMIADIFAANITMWNDPRVVAINANITLPAQNITVILSDELTGEAEAASQAMADISLVFSSLVTPGLLPNWPYSSYASTFRCAGDDCVTAAVSLADGAIGLTALGNALDHKISYASILKYDQVVVASDTSASFAFVELAPLPVSAALITDITEPLPQSLINPIGAQAWPINRMAWLTHRMVFSNDNNGTSYCPQKAVMLSFLLFMLQSPQAKQVMTNNMLAAIPDAGLTSLESIVVALNTYIFCDNVSLAVTASNLGLPYATITIAPELITGPLQAVRLFQLFQTFLSSINQYIGNGRERIYISTRSSSTSYEQTKSGYTSSGLLVLDDLAPQQAQELTDLIASGQFILLPVFAFAISPIYSRVIVDSNGVSQVLPPSLKLDSNAVAALLTRQMTDWGALSYLNPSLQNISADVRPVWACSEDGLVATTIPLLLFMAYQLGAVIPDEFAASATFMCNSSVFSLSSFVDTPASGIFAAPLESSEGSILSVAHGGFSASIWDPTALRDLINVDFAQVSFTGNGTHFLSPSVSSILACFDTFNPDTLLTDVTRSLSSDCYKFTRPVYMMLPAIYNDTDQNSCAVARIDLYTILALLENDELSSVLSEKGLARPSDIPAVRIALNKKLNQVQCVDPLTGDSFSALIRLPDSWSPSSTLTLLALIVGAIGIFLSIVALVFVSIYRHHSAIAIRSVVFLILTIGGTVLVQIASILMTLKATPNACTALSWIAHLGFALMLMPVFVQCYRVYTIWGHANLRVVKISNRRLLSYIAIELIAEIALLVAAQLISPLQSVEILYTDSSSRVHSYIICGLDSTIGSAIFGLQAGLKGLLLIFGAVYGFSSRTISERFSQSSAIAITIYNCLLTVCVVVLVIVLANVRGDSLIGMIAFGGLWITIVTQLLTFVPRVRAVVSSNVNLSVNPVNDGEVGFSLLSVAAFTTPESMAQYRDAIDAQLVKARARLATLQRENANIDRPLKLTQSIHNHNQSIHNQSIHNQSVMSDDESSNSWQDPKAKQLRSISSASLARPKQPQMFVAPSINPSINQSINHLTRTTALSPSNKTLNVPPIATLKPTLKPVEVVEMSPRSDADQPVNQSINQSFSDRPMSARDTAPQLKSTRNMSRKATA